MSDGSDRLQGFGALAGTDVPEEMQKERERARGVSTVWVVAADKMDGSHPAVLGVYDNEDAAKEHEAAIHANGGCIRANGYDHPVASFWTYEKQVDSEYGGTNESK